LVGLRVKKNLVDAKILKLLPQFVCSHLHWRKVNLSILVTVLRDDDGTKIFIAAHALAARFS
jgi:hypothetical protein